MKMNSFFQCGNYKNALNPTYSKNNDNISMTICKPEHESFAFSTDRSSESLKCSHLEVENQTHMGQINSTVPSPPSSNPALSIT